MRAGTNCLAICIVYPNFGFPDFDLVVEVLAADYAEYMSGGHHHDSGLREAWYAVQVDQVDDFVNRVEGALIARFGPHEGFVLHQDVDDDA